MPDLTIKTQHYNDCFVLGTKVRTKDGKLIKAPVYLHWYWGTPNLLWGGIDGENKSWYHMSYEKAYDRLQDYQNNSRGQIFAEGDETKGDEDLRVSLYLDNAMYGNLHIFVIDFDNFDENSSFFIKAKELADKVTRSQGGGYHMFYGINKEVATSLFDDINLLASSNAKSYISYTGAVTLDGENKVDFFCDALRFIYEWEEWDNSVGLTDKTQELYELIKDNFALKRPMGGRKSETNRETGKSETNQGTRKSGTHQKTKNSTVVSQDTQSEQDLLSRMDKAQKKIFEHLKTISPDCTRSEWFSIGLNIWHIYGDELGGDVFRYWSEPGHSYQPQGCAVTWDNICDRGPETSLNNWKWKKIWYDNLPNAIESTLTK